MESVFVVHSVHAVVWSVFVVHSVHAVVWSLFVVHSVHAVVWSVFVYSVRVPTFSKYQIPGFLKVFDPKFQVFSRFLVPNFRYFHTNFSYKNFEMC